MKTLLMSVALLSGLCFPQLIRGADETPATEKKEIIAGQTDIKQDRKELTAANQQLKSDGLALKAAREGYRDAVAKHGSKSPEALAAREKLESARKTYMADRKTANKDRKDIHKDSVQVRKERHELMKERRETHATTPGSK